MKNTRSTNRRGATAILVTALMVPLLGLLAFSVDYGYLLYLRTDMQRVADQAALAAVRELVPGPAGEQSASAAREMAHEYVELNYGDQFTVNDSDIKVGRYNPETVYNSLEILDDGIADTVQVILRRDDAANTSVTLYFARLFGRDEQGISVVSTAALQKARYLAPGTDLLPIGISTESWETLDPGDEFSIYGDGQLQNDVGQNIPGNWGTMDVGANSNSTADIKDQITNGLSQSDLDAMHNQGSIPTNEYIDNALDITLNGDTGFSGGMKNAMEPEIGKTKLVPIYASTNADAGQSGNSNSGNNGKGKGKGGNNGGGNTGGNGGNLDFEIVGWGVVKIIDLDFQGSQNSRLDVQKAYLYDQDLRPNRDLSNTTDVIEGAYTGSVLIQ